MAVQAAVLILGIWLALRTGSGAWLWLCLCAVFLPAAAMALVALAAGWWQDRQDRRTIRADAVRTYAVDADGTAHLYRTECR